MQRLITLQIVDGAQRCGEGDHDLTLASLLEDDLGNQNNQVLIHSKRLGKPQFSHNKLFLDQLPTGIDRLRNSYAAVLGSQIVDILAHSMPKPKKE
ncbi:MAG: hypothetical protein M3Y18_09230 [Candidatus Eremiobacteraeota bacterium]|nr:hypothetical protein [Candidatus Eremiobacteraeota bacterium]